MAEYMLLTDLVLGAREVDCECSGLAVEGVVGHEGRGGIDSWD